MWVPLAATTRLELQDGHLTRERRGQRDDFCVSEVNDIKVVHQGYWSAAALLAPFGLHMRTLCGVACDGALSTITRSFLRSAGAAWFVEAHAVVCMVSTPSVGGAARRHTYCDPSAVRWPFVAHPHMHL
jgi:hypothetical protein